MSSGEDGKNSDKQCGSVTYFSGSNTFRRAHLSGLYL